MTRLALLLIATLGCLCAEANAPRLLVHWQTEEPDYASNVRLAIVCEPDNPGCGTPRAWFDHYEMFDSEAQAIEFINDDFGTAHKSSTAATGIVNGTILGFRPRTAITGKRLVALYALRSVKLKATEYTVEIPQPPKVEQRTKVEKQ